MIIEAAAGYAKGITKIGSTPPSCEHKCHGCTPCEAIQVPAISKTGTHHLSVNYANYEPEGWKCKCGPSFYSPWTPETCSLIDSFLLMFEIMITLFLYIFFVFILVQVIFMWILTFCQFFQGQRKICNTCVVYLNTELDWPFFSLFLFHKSDCVDYNHLDYSLNDKSIETAP